MHVRYAVLVAFGMLPFAVPAPGQRPVRAADAPLPLIRELSIGAPDGPPEYALGQIQRVATLVSGTIFVFDAADTQIRRYDLKGRFLGPVGRSGAGPGEYRQVLGMAMHGDSLLLVYDPANARISIFDTTGRYQRQIGLRRGAFYGAKEFFVDATGRIYVRYGAGRPLGPGQPIPSQYVRFRLDGTVLDSLPIPNETAASAFVLMTSDGPRWSFTDQAVFAPLPAGGLITARSTIYRLRLDPDGEAQRTIERPAQRLPVEGPEREEWEAWAQYFTTRPGATGKAKIPSTKPAIRDVYVDPLGRIWVDVYRRAVKQDIPPRPPGDHRPLLTIREPNTYDLFAGSGAYLGRVALPAASVLMDVRADRIWVLTEAAKGEQVLVRYHVRGLPAR
jgi:hypothetical protein